MQYKKKYLQKIKERLNEKLSESISKTTEDIGNQHIRNFSFISHEIGLLFAMCNLENWSNVWRYVQSRRFRISRIHLTHNRQCCLATTNLRSS